jgi:hypothetical protein
MLRRLTTIGVIASALIVISSGIAAAEWYDEGTALNSGENPTIELTGTWAFTSSGGGLHCNTSTMKLQFTGGTTDGHLLSTTIEEPSKCEISGGTVFLCAGTTTFKSATLTGTPTLVNNGGSNVQISGIVTHLECNNGFKVTLSSIAGQPSTLTPNNSTCISSWTLSGELNSTLAAGKLKFSGQLNVLAPNACTYGLVS